MLTFMTASESLLSFAARSFFCLDTMPLTQVNPEDTISRRYTGGKENKKKKKGNTFELRFSLDKLTDAVIRQHFTIIWGRL